MNERPISPHLQIYRLPFTAWMSISHRATGVFLVLGLVGLAVGLMAIAEGPQAYALFQSKLESNLGQFLLWGLIYALFFHLCHGVRHLIWDTGHGFERQTLNFYSGLELAASWILTGSVFLFRWVFP